jgi:hypothetical protein
MLYVVCVEIETIDNFETSLIYINVYIKAKLSYHRKAYRLVKC